MSSASPLEADTLWDEWCAVRAESPELTPEHFAARFGDQRADALDLLATLLAVEEEAPLPSLVRVLRPGDDGDLRFAGFKLLSELGEGSAGIVYEAIDERPGGDGGRVALKLLNPVLGGGSSSREAILREARITSALDHPSIVRVLGSGTEQGYAWIATELVEGEPLEEWIDSERPAAERINRALEVGLQIASALEHAHQRGVLHRDLKPANVMRGADGAVKVLDFGLARREGAAFGVSHTGEVVGTPLYMAPEQLRGAPDLDGRADLYALGLVMLELATGKRLSVRDAALKTLARIARGRGRFSGRLLAGLPKDLAGLLSRCIEPDRRDRYTDAHALIEDLEALRAGRRPRLSKLGVVVRSWHGVVRRPVRAAVVAVLLGLGVLAGRWVAGHLPIAITVDSLMARSGAVWVDGEEKGTSLPLSLSFWRRGTHTIEFSDGTYRYPFEIDVREGGARSFFLPFGRFYRQQQLVGTPEGKVGEQVGFLQVGVRPADRSDHHGSFRVSLRVPGGLDQSAPGISTFPLGIREQPYVLHVERDGFRSRDITIPMTDGRTPSVMLELDPLDSPWHTIMVSSPLDPVVESGLLSMENLTLRWETTQRDGFSDGLVHRVGLGVIDPDRPGVLHFKIPWPEDVDVGEIQVLGIADPETHSGNGVYSGQGMYLAMGPSEEDLVSVLDWNFPDADPAVGLVTPDFQTRLNRAMRESGGRELHVRYETIGEASWILRTNALPRRKTNDAIHWDPALRLRVRASGPEVEARTPLASAPLLPRPNAKRVVDLAMGRGVSTFDGGPPGEFVDFNLASGMDANGDMTNDFALRVNDGSERVEIRSGTDGTTLLELEGEPGDGFGHALTFVPDLDGDGCADLLVGAPQHDSQSGDRRGYIRLYSGRTRAVLGHADGEMSHELFGLCLDYIGDLGGDGLHSAIASTLEPEAGGWGNAKVLSLPDLQVRQHISGREHGDHFGNACSGVGDVNADGIPDFAVGSYNEDAPFWDSGAVHVYSGDASAGLPLIHRLVGDHMFDLLGRHVAFAGDLDGDGHADLLTHCLSGVLAVSGKTGTTLYKFSPGPGEEYRAPALVTDLDLDGLRDIAVHGYRQLEPDVEGGKIIWLPFAFVFSPGTGELLLEVRGVPGGASPLLAPAPDIDGDGREELLLGLGRREGEERARMLFLLSGE
jgi:hypothetical protein